MWLSTCTWQPTLICCVQKPIHMQEPVDVCADLYMDAGSVLLNVGQPDKALPFLRCRGRLDRWLVGGWRLLMQPEGGCVWLLPAIAIQAILFVLLLTQLLTQPLLPARCRRLYPAGRLRRCRRSAGPRCGRAWRSATAPWTSRSRRWT